VESAGSIDWDMATTATRCLPKFKQLWVSKLATKFLPYGKNMRRWNLRQQARCPRCSCLVEDKEHIFKCQEASAVKQWNKALDDLDQWLQSQHSHPQIRQDIIHGLRQWHDDKPQCWTTSGSTAAQLQDTIGWGAVLEGCISRSWQEEQDQFWKAIKSRKSSWRWTTALLTRLMLTAWDMWQHCNKALHESDINRQAILEEEVNDQIRQVYTQGLGQLPADAKHFMKCPLTKLLKLPASYKNQWIASVDAARIWYIQQKASPTYPERKFMTDYFYWLAHLH